MMLYCNILADRVLPQLGLTEREGQERLTKMIKICFDIFVILGLLNLVIDLYKNISTELNAHDFKWSNLIVNGILKMPVTLFQSAFVRYVLIYSMFVYLSTFYSSFATYLVIALIEVVFVLILLHNILVKTLGKSYSNLDKYGIDWVISMCKKLTACDEYLSYKMKNPTISLLDETFSLLDMVLIAVSVSLLFKNNKMDFHAFLYEYCALFVVITLYGWILDSFLLFVKLPAKEVKDESGAEVGDDVKTSLFISSGVSPSSSATGKPKNSEGTVNKLMSSFKFGVLVKTLLVPLICFVILHFAARKFNYTNNIIKGGNSKIVSLFKKSSLAVVKEQVQDFVSSVA